MKASLQDLVMVGIDLAKEETITVSDLISLLDCASQEKDEEHLQCSKALCSQVLDGDLKVNGLAMNDKEIGEFLKAAKDALGTKAIPIANHLLNSSNWGFQSLSSKVLAKVQTMYVCEGVVKQSNA